MDIVAIRSVAGRYTFSLQVCPGVAAEWIYSILITQTGGWQARYMLLDGLPAQPDFERFCSTFARYPNPTVAAQASPLRIVYIADPA